MSMLQGYMRALYLSVVRFHPMTPAERAAFFESYLRFPERWQPQRFGLNAPLRQFSAERWREQLPDDRKYGLLWSRRKPGIEAHFLSQIERDPDEWLNMMLELAAFAETELIDQSAKLAMILDADILTLQVLSLQEAAHARQLRAAEPDPFKKEASWSSIVPAHRYAFGIPHLGWATIFGPVYIRHFGLDKLLSAPAPIVRKISDSHVLVQFAATYQEVDSEWDRFNAVRDAVLDHLGRESFQRPRTNPDDPPPMYELDQNGVPATSIPPELASWRRELESRYAKSRAAPSIFDRMPLKRGTQNEEGSRY